MGVFSQYLQQSKLIEGSMIYNNTEFYLQDNWKVNGKLTLDYGVRFTRQQPQHDQFQQMSNFFADQWSLGAAPLLYLAGCNNGATVCSGNARNAVDPRTGQILTAAGAANTAAAIGTVVPGSGNLTNGVKQAGNGIADTSYVWPTLVVAPRFGLAYDVAGNQRVVIRGGGGLFFDRPDGNTVFSIPGNPPISTSQDLRNGQLQTLGTGLSTTGVPALITFQYDAKVPSSWQWQGGAQFALPWATVLDVTYVGSHGFNRLRAFQGGANGSVDVNAVDFGAAYLPQNQDPTLGPSAVPGASAYTSNLLRAYRGFSNINEQQTRFWDEYHGLQMSASRRLQNGLAFGANYNLGLSFKGNTGLQLRLQHAADGTLSVRSDQADYEKLNENLAMQRHVIKAYAVWDLPGPSRLGSVGKVLLSDWQLSGVLTAGSAYQPGAQQANGTAQANPAGDVNGRYDITYHLPEQRRGGEPDRIAGLQRQDRVRGGSRFGLLRQSVRAIQHRDDQGADLRQPRARVGPVPARRLPEQDGRHGHRADRQAPRRAAAGVPTPGVQPVQHGRDQRPREERHLSQPDGSNRRQLAVSAGRHARPEPADAAERRIRRGDRRAADAEYTADDQIYVLKRHDRRQEHEDDGAKLSRLRLGSVLRVPGGDQLGAFCIGAARVSRNHPSLRSFPPLSPPTAWRATTIA